MGAFIRVLACLALCLLAADATAHDEEGAPPPQGWSGTIAAGYVAVSGNSDSTTSNFKGEVTYDHDRWHDSALATALGASQNGETNSEAYKAQVKTKYDLTEIIYAFGLAEWNKDRFTSYEHQIFEVGGLGWRVFHTKSQELNLEGGIGATQSELQDGSNNNEVVARIGADYHWHISEKGLFSEKLASTRGSDNTYFESLTELKAGVIGNLALVLGYLVKHNTDVLPGTDKTDTQTSISLEYKF
jgi:putative salt-induced outer membrane protein